MVNRNEQDVESYENDYPLERLFHNAAARVLDFLILNQQLSYSAEAGPAAQAWAPVQEQQVPVVPPVEEQGQVLLQALYSPSVRERALPMPDLADHLIDEESGRSPG